MRFSRCGCRSITCVLCAGAIFLLTGCQGITPQKANPGPTQSVALSPSSSPLVFGAVQKSKSSNLTETLTNTSATDITITAANVSGAGFAVSGLSLPMTLASNHSVTFTATFQPATQGAASGTLAISSTAANPTLDIALSGSEMAQGQLSVQPGNLNFGNVAVGANSALNGTLEASGSAVTISSAGSNSSEFSISGISLPVTLSAGQNASFTITFNPSASGTASAQVVFSSDAANSPGSEMLAGTGVAATQHSVTLSWAAASAADVAGYNIYRSGAANGPYSKINGSLESSTAYTDTTVAAGLSYYYVATTVSGSGEESGYSQSVEVVIPTS